MQILRMREVCSRTGLSRPTIYRLIKRGEFPRATNLGAKAVGWFEHQVDEWLEERLNQPSLDLGLKVSSPPSSRGDQASQ